MTRSAPARLIAATAIVLAPHFALAADWANTSGGDFSLSSNWQGNSPPGTNDPAIFNTGGVPDFSGNPAYIGMIRTTCVPTMLSGGHADNALPQSATATINCRIFPGIVAKGIEDTLRQLAGPKAEIHGLATVIEGPASPLRPDVTAAVTEVVHHLHPGIPIIPQQASGATDGAVFNGVGIPTYGTGQNFIKNSDDFSHGLNERIPVKSFYDGLDFWYLLLKRVSSPSPS